MVVQLLEGDGGGRMWGRCAVVVVVVMLPGNEHGL